MFWGAVPEWALVIVTATLFWGVAAFLARDLVRVSDILSYWIPMNGRHAGECIVEMMA